MISAADLAAFQNDVLLAQPNTCQIYRGVLTTDTTTGGSISTSTLLSTTTCRIEAYSEIGQEVVEQERLESRTKWNIYLPAYTNVLPTDQLVVSGATYEIDKVVSGMSYEIERRAECWLLQ